MDTQTLLDLLSNINIGYLKTVIERNGHELPQESQEYAIKLRLNPVTYMSKLTPEPFALLEYMQKSKIVLSGSMAAAYFNPSLSRPSSDWDFYVPDVELEDGSFPNTEKFTAFLKSLGMREIGMLDTDHIEYEMTISGIQKITTMQTLYNEGHRVQIISHRFTSNIDILATFDLSAVQCMITGYCAVSMYHTSTMNGEAFWWKSRRAKELEHEYIRERDYYPEISGDELGSYKQLSRLHSRLVKYANRGLIIKKPDPSTYCIERYVGDSESLVICFDDYGLKKNRDMDLKEPIKWSLLEDRICSNLNNASYPF